MFGSIGFQEIILIIVLTTLLSFLLFYLTETNDDRSYKRLLSLIRITEDKKRKKADEKEENLFKRLYKQFETSVVHFVEKQIQKGNLSNLTLKIQQSGLSTNTTEIWTKCIIYGLIGSFIGIVSQKPLFILIFAGVGVYIPFRKLKESIKERQFILLNQLPDFLDLVAVTFPTTNNIEETFEVVCERSNSEISKEFQIVVNEIKLGRKKREVYDELSNRTGLSEISTLVSQINQAEVFGTGLEDVLVTQSRTIRQAKKAMAEERGASAKFQMYLPAIIMMMIAMAIIVFPFIMPIIESFGDGMM